jgi:signal transduction histidine kinase
VLADPVLMTRILRNLLTNALLHSRGRRVGLLARRRARGGLVVFFTACIIAQVARVRTSPL